MSERNLVFSVPTTREERHEEMFGGDGLDTFMTLSGMMGSQGDTYVQTHQNAYIKCAVFCYTSIKLLIKNHVTFKIV